LTPLLQKQAALLLWKLSETETGARDIISGAGMQRLVQLFTSGAGKPHIRDCNICASSSLTRLCS
jgi:hypothetical protein